MLSPASGRLPRAQCRPGAGNGLTGSGKAPRVRRVGARGRSRGMDTAGESGGEDRRTLLDPGRTEGCSWWLFVSKTAPRGFALRLF